MRTQLSFYDLNVELYEKTLDNVIKFPEKKCRTKDKKEKNHAN